MSARFRGYLAVLLSAGLFALVAILTKFAYRLGMTAGQILTTQTTLSAFILLLYALVFKHDMVRIKLSQAPKLLAQGLIGSLGTSFLFTYALLYIPANLGAVLLFTYPVLVTFVAYIFLRAKVRGVEVVALIFAVGGTVLSTQIWQVSLATVQFRGIILGLAAAVCYTFFILYGERLLDNLNPLTTLLYVQVFSSIFLLSYRLQNSEAGSALFAANWAQLLVCFVMATFASILPLWLLLVGIKYIGATKASIIGTLELPLTFVLAFIFLHEKFGLWQTAGAVLITLSILVLRARDLHPGT
ncbi:MAG: DMT family transporter [Peptococcaceae bacterium]|nr:DMT family transporter [Peptococcaceae bacterium]